MNRRDTIKAIGIGTLLGAGAGTATAGPGGGESGDASNPGRVGSYNGEKTLVPPGLGGFDHVLVYLAEPLVEGDWSVVENAERFQREIMSRDTEEVEAARRSAEAFYEERFGLTFPGETGLFEPEESADGTAVLNPFYQDPDVGYNAYVVSGRAMPNNHGDGATNRDETLAGKVRDGGWIVSITEDTTLGGELRRERRVRRRCGYRTGVGPLQHQNGRRRGPHRDPLRVRTPDPADGHAGRVQLRPVPRRVGRGPGPGNDQHPRGWHPERAHVPLVAVV